MGKIYCKNYGQKFGKEDEVYSNCDDKKKFRKISFEEKIELHDKVRGKIKKRGKRITQEFKVGDDLYRKSGKWNYKEMYIDRGEKLYKEIVKDKDTGKIIHKCEEPRSNHKGHGSAKYRKSKSNN